MVILTFPCDPGPGFIRLCSQLGRHVHPCLCGCAVADARMPSLPVIEDFDILKERCASLSPRSEAGAMNHLGLQGTDEALHGRVVQAVSLPAPRYGHAVQIEQLLVLTASVLDASVRMMDQPFWGPPIPDRHLNASSQRVLLRRSDGPAEQGLTFEFFWVPVDDALPSKLNPLFAETANIMLRYQNS